MAETLDSNIDINLEQVPPSIEEIDYALYDYLKSLHDTIEILTQELSDLKDKVWTHHP